jgi:hypothetical protein
MSTHTPGPWTVRILDRGSYGGERYVISAGETDLADLRWNGHNEKHGKAHARLIAQAPAMLEALREAVRIASDEHGEVFHNDLKERESAIIAWKQHVRALLAQIEGKS